ncbi:hypothetical protein, partial [Stenotrophomonas sepilia]|uniref:hypothetical protein n=1 Tax=Stenotrophomonas sepilia TaxID=2860290 RepID=UPI00289A092E
GHCHQLWQPDVYERLAGPALDVGAAPDAHASDQRPCAIGLPNWGTALTQRHPGEPRVVIDRSSDVWAWEWSNKSEVFGDWIPSADPQDDGVVFELGLRFWQIASDDHLDK